MKRNDGTDAHSCCNIHDMDTVERSVAEDSRTDAGLGHVNIDEEGRAKPAAKFEIQDGDVEAGKGNNGELPW